MIRTVAGSGPHPVIDRVFPFEQLADAYRYFQTAPHFGKVALAMSP